jgi:hypothetical protein
MLQGKNISNRKETRLLSKGTFLYSVCFQGDWDRKTFFLERGDALLALLDSIFVRDTLGLKTINRSFNQNRAPSHRFESLVQIHKYVVLEDGVKGIMSNGFIEVPVITPGTSINRNTLDMDDWVSLVVDDGVYRVDHPVKMTTISKPRTDLLLLNFLRIDMGKYYSFYFSMLMDGYAFDAMVNKFFRGDFITEWSTTMLSSTPHPYLLNDYYPSDFPETREIIVGIENGWSLKQLARLASYSSKGQEYIMTDNFYEKMWGRDLIIFDYPERETPAYYMPARSYSYNYHRLLDVETIKRWYDIHQSNIYPKVKPTKKAQSNIIRFDDKKIETFTSIDILNEKLDFRSHIRFETRGMMTFLFIQITLNEGDDDANIVSLIQDFKNRIDADNIRNWEAGRVKNTAVYDMDSFAINTRFKETKNILIEFLGFLIREYHCCIVRFG